jgi:hypothetical protein
MVSVSVSGESYYDDSNGIFRSQKPVHKVIVPAKALDAAREYTVRLVPLIERKPYFTETAEPEEYTYSFRPVPKNPRCYHISDAHNRIEQPCLAAKTFGDIDFLVMNGDIPDHCGELENCKNIYVIADELTKGEIPIIFSRGNHDMRGVWAEEFANYTPSANGRTYFNVKLGNLWAMVLDCGEDKADDSQEYGNTICCHSFRLDQTRFLKKVIANAEKEYNAPGVTKRVIISHTPFTRVNRPPFDIEQPLYKEWIAMIGEHIKPDFYLSGHLHTCQVIRPGDAEDSFGQSCPTVVGAIPYRDEWDKFTACGITYDDGITVRFTDQDKNVLETHTL